MTRILPFPRITGVLLVLVSINTMSWARKDVPNPYHMLATASDVVSVVRVVSARSRWSGNHIVTIARAEIVELYKGTSVDPSLRIAFVGGTVGNIQERVSHSSTLSVGRTYLVFLNHAHTIADEHFEHFRIVSELGAVPILRRDESQERLTYNRRLRRFLNEIARVARRKEPVQ